MMKKAKNCLYFAHKHKIFEMGRRTAMRFQQQAFIQVRFESYADIFPHNNQEVCEP